MAGNMDFGAPRVGPNTDLAKSQKLAQRVEETLKTKLVHQEPKQLDPRCVLVAPHNRNGGPPNVQHIHWGILKSFIQKGFDRSRPQVGICVQYTSEEGKRKLLEHNTRFTKGEDLLPPIDDTKSLYGSLAGSHLNLALRFLRSGKSSPAGDVSALLNEPSLKEVVMNGHRWWILQEDTAVEQQVDISLWRNQDQNENQLTHEIEILQNIMVTAKGLSAHHQSITMGDLIAKVGKKMPTKISVESLRILVKFYVQFINSGDQNLVEELVDFHSTHVNPRELVVSTRFFQFLTSEPALENAPFLRHYLLLTQYTTDKCTVQAGGPSIAAFLDPQSQVNLCRKTQVVSQLESKIRELRDKYLPILERSLGAKLARDEIAIYMNLIIRCLLAKPYPASMHISFATGKYSPEKIQDLGILWASFLDSKHVDMNFAIEAGLEPREKTPNEDLEQSVGLDKIRVLKKTASEELPTSKEFTRGDLVTVINKMTWPVPLDGRPEYRKNINVGTSGTVEGWADKEHRQLLLSVVLDLPTGQQRVTHTASVRNLQLTRDFEMQRGGQTPAPPSTSSPQADLQTKGIKRSVAPEWLLGNSTPETVRVQASWADLQADADNLNRNMWLRSRIGLCLQSLYELLPRFTEEDLVVCHRQNNKGVWRVEVWTNRSFAAQELILAPFSSQIKDTHLMFSSNAPVALPKHGRGAHPENLSLALDGRGRTSMSQAGTIEDKENTGCLYWLITRTSEFSEANLVLEPIHWSSSVEIKLPNKKTKQSDKWDSAQLPQVPVLVNKQGLKAHTCLKVFLEDKKDMTMAKESPRGK